MVFLTRFSLAGLTALLLISGPAISEDKFRVCSDPLNPPFAQKNGQGFELDIARLFARELNQTVEIYWFPQRIGFIRNTLKSELPEGQGYKCDIVMGVPASYDMLMTTRPYYHSTYVMLIAKGRGWDDITKPEQLKNLPVSRQEKLRIAMFDRGPGTAWLQNSGLLNQGIPYQTMTGDNENNTAMMIEKDLKAGKIDMVILWGPMAGYILSQSPKGTYTEMIMQSIPRLKFDFSIAMGVRYGDKNRQQTLNRLIGENLPEIQNILKRYHVPLLPIPEQKKDQEDDD